MITPLNGGVVDIKSSRGVLTSGTLYSPQYIKVKDLELRPTEWVPGGRPIYRRLPSSCQTYQVDFFADGEVGYVYLPFGEGMFGPTSLEVVSSDNRESLIIKSGTIVWEKGRSEMDAAILNIKDIDLGSGKYFLGYELVYDDSPRDLQYSVSDYSLDGVPLTLTASTGSDFGWRFPPKNAFVPETDLFWKNFDTLLPDYAQPAESYLRWQSEKPSALSAIRVNLPPQTVMPPTVEATLSYGAGSKWVPAASAKLTMGGGQNFFLFEVDAPTFQDSWQVSWASEDGSPYLEVSVESIEVSGVITLSRKPVTPSINTSLVIYPENTVPSGKTYCHLAMVDINSSFEVTDIQDERNIIHRDYTPVADWLTKPWDDNLTNLYEQVSDYANLWMSAPSCMNFEYENLTKYGIQVT